MVERPEDFYRPTVTEDQLRALAGQLNNLLSSNPNEAGKILAEFIRNLPNHKRLGALCLLHDCAYDYPAVRKMLDRLLYW